MYVIFLYHVLVPNKLGFIQRSTSLIFKILVEIDPGVSRKVEIIQTNRDEQLTETYKLYITNKLLCAYIKRICVITNLNLMRTLVPIHVPRTMRARLTTS